MSLNSGRHPALFLGASGFHFPNDLNDIAVLNTLALTSQTIAAKRTTYTYKNHILYQMLQRLLQVTPRDSLAVSYFSVLQWLRLRMIRNLEYSFGGK